MPVEFSAFVDEVEKIARALTPEARAEMPKKDFAEPNKKEDGQKGKYPIPDRRHAAIAMGFAKMHHDSKAMADVRRKVEQKYPDMLHKKAAEESNAKGTALGAGAGAAAGAGYAHYKIRKGIKTMKSEKFRRPLAKAFKDAGDAFGGGEMGKSFSQGMRGGVFKATRTGIKAYRIGVPIVGAAVGAGIGHHISKKRKEAA
jgi:hypothetical protein